MHHPPQTKHHLLSQVRINLQRQYLLIEVVSLLIVGRWCVEISFLRLLCDSLGEFDIDLSNLRFSSGREEAVNFGAVDCLGLFKRSVFEIGLGFEKSGFPAPRGVWVRHQNLVADLNRIGELIVVKECQPFEIEQEIPLVLCRVEGYINLFDGGFKLLRL